MSLKDVLAAAASEFLATHREEYARRVEAEARSEAQVVRMPPPSAEAQKRAQDLLDSLTAWIAAHPQDMQFGDRPNEVVFPMPLAFRPSVAWDDYRAWRNLLHDADIHYNHDAEQLQWFADV